MLLTANRLIVTVAPMHRSSWLQSSERRQEVQQTLQDLPFEGSLFFSRKTDDRLQGCKDFKATFKSLELYILTSSRKQYRPQQVSCYFLQTMRQDHQRRRNRRFGLRSPPQSSSSGSWPIGTLGCQNTRFDKILEFDVIKS